MTQQSQSFVRAFQTPPPHRLAHAVKPCLTCTHYQPKSPTPCRKTGGPSDAKGCAGHSGRAQQ